MGERLSFIKNSDTFSRLSSLRYLPRWMVLICDLIICAAAYLITHYLFLQMGNAFDYRTTTLLQRLVIILVSQTAFFWLFHTYSGVLRYSTYIDASKLLFSVVLNVSFLLLVTFVYQLLTGIYLFFYLSLLGYAVFAFSFLFLLRLVVKTAYDYYIQNFQHIIPIMIYGTRSAGIGIAKMIRATPDSKYKVVGFIDDDNISTKRVIMGFKIYKKDEKTVRDIIAKRARAVIVSPLKMEKIDANKDLDVFLNNNISIYTVPLVSIWKGEESLEKQIKSIQIEDLLERPQIKISTDNISRQLGGKVVLVTGAAGSIGSEIVRQMSQYKPALIVLLDQAESPIHDLKLEMEEKFPDQSISVILGDIRNKERMEYIMELYRPDVVYHVAAYKHVPLMEDYPGESILVNVMGTKTIADLSVKYQVKRFVMVSTDKAVNPTNVMGASKRIAEIYVQSLFKRNIERDPDTTKFITTRFGNVLGSNGSVIPLFKKQIEHGGPVTVTHPNITRYFMTIPEACMLVLEAAAMGEGGEVFIFDMGNPIKIVDLARKMIRLSGYVPEEDIKIVYTGLRPGEKLYEELLNKKEITHETHNPKIMIATVQEYNFDEIEPEIEELIRYSHLYKDYLIVSQMKKIVPEFLSKNSKYEKLDITHKSTIQ